MSFEHRRGGYASSMLRGWGHALWVFPLASDTVDSLRWGVLREPEDPDERRGRTRATGTMNEPFSAGRLDRAVSPPAPSDSERSVRAGQPRSRARRAGDERC